MMDYMQNLGRVRQNMTTTISFLVDNARLRETIIYWMPKDEKKQQILKLVPKEVEMFQ